MEVGTMTAQTQHADAISTNVTPERTARFWPGIPLLVLAVALALAAVAAFYEASQHKGAALGLTWAGAILVLAAIFLLRGLTPVAPGRAHVVQLFGKYRGTIR